MAEEFLLDCRLDQPSILAGQSADLYSLVTIRPNISKLGALLESAGNAPLPAHLIVIVDVSGSMSTIIEEDPNARIVGTGVSEGNSVTYIETTVPSRLIVAQRVVHRLVDRLGPDDRMTLVAFDHQSYVLATELPRGSQLSDAVEQLAQCGGGGTSMGHAFNAIRSSIRPTSGKARTQRIVVLTDGEDQEPDVALREAEALGQEQHIPIYAFGTGQSRADFLMKLCKVTLGGAFRDIANEREAEECFSDFFTTQKNILATNVAIELWLSPEMYVRELFRTRPEILFVGDIKPDASNTVRISIEYMEKEKVYEFLFRCTVPARDVGRFRLAKATLLYDLPALGLLEQRAEANIVVEFTSDGEKAQVRIGDVRKVIAQAEVQRQLLFLQEKKDAIEAGIATERDKKIVASLLDELVRKFQELGDQANCNMYKAMKEEYLRNGTISQETMNRSLAASSKVEGGVAVVDVDDF